MKSTSIQHSQTSLNDFEARADTQTDSVISLKPKFEKIRQISINTRLEKNRLVDLFNEKVAFTK